MIKYNNFMLDTVMGYVVIYEEGPTSCGAGVPDLPGCFSIGDNFVEVQKLIKEAIEFHIEGLKEDDEEIPQPILKLPICDNDPNMLKEYDFSDGVVGKYVNHENKEQSNE